MNHHPLRSYKKIVYALVAAVLLSPAPSALAGWTGQMNGTGFGKAAVNVTSSTGDTNAVGTPNMQGPSAAMTNTATYFAGGPLPAGASKSTVARIKGSAGYVWKATTLASNGDKTDNKEIQGRVFITPSDCAFLDIDSSAIISPDGHSGTITVNATATAGAAMLLRGFEYHGDVPPESIDDLKTNGVLKWDILMVGPFDLNKSNCNALVVPFTVDAGASNLYFVADGAAVTRPLTITCAGDVEFGCFLPDTALAYPAPVITAGCGTVTVSFNPPASALPVGVTTVTATVTDTLGNTAQCTFIATRHGLGFTGFDSPIDGTGGSCDAPLRTINKGSKIPVKFTISCDGSPTFSGQPTLSIRKCPSGQIVGGGNFQIVANEWHFNWDTTGLNAGTYRLIATLQDGSTKEVFVKIK
jgi:hypothetical protein